MFKSSELSKRGLFKKGFTCLKTFFAQFMPSLMLSNTRQSILSLSWSEKTSPERHGKIFVPVLPSVD